MGFIFRHIAVMCYLCNVGATHSNDVLPRGSRSRVKSDSQPHQVAVDADQSQTPAKATSVEFESPVDKSQ